MNVDEWLMKQPSEIEVAELLHAATKENHQLSSEGVRILRRLAFDWNRLKSRLNHQTDEDMENCRKGFHGKDCGRK